MPSEIYCRDISFNNSSKNQSTNSSKIYIVEKNKWFVDILSSRLRSKFIPYDYNLKKRIFIHEK